MQTTTTLWEDLVTDPRFQDLPYKVETTEHGQIILSPHKLWHSFAQSEIVDLLREHITRPGRRAVEFAVETPSGIKTPDVIWISKARLAQVPAGAATSAVMPELVVEVMSEGNTRAEMEKRRLYLDGGAIEVWVVTPDGTVAFFDASGSISASSLAPAFPTQLKIL